MMDAVRELFYKPRVLLIGSGEEYGHIKDNECPITEENALRPGNIYAATKACQNMIGNIYYRAYDMQVMMVRAFNHIGPGQSPIFVVSDFCKQVVEIEKGLKEPVMYVGNLKAMRDFTDVRDVVKAYGALIRKGAPGETYNVGSGKAVSIQHVLDKIISMAHKEIKVETDPNKIRPVDVPIIEADITKLTGCTGWKPEIGLEQTIGEILDYWRARL
jgi:GDP-4-dehydro-6-deoxy-D-mannose reductase